MSDRVLVDVDAGVADVRLNRSDKLNACDFAMFDALSKAGRALAEERSRARLERDWSRADELKASIAAAGWKVVDDGPVFFRQRRYGQNNKIFRIFKFRTMTVTEDGPVVVQATKNDSRVTYIGRFLRGSSLDEVPQLINVLLGDMSIVGPRPHAIAHDEDFDSKLDLFSRRRRVRPGLTGWAQVNGYRGETKTLESIEGRMQHDLYYIDNWSIWLDLEIVARTILILGKKAY